MKTKSRKKSEVSTPPKETEKQRKKLKFLVALAALAGKLESPKCPIDVAKNKKYGPCGKPGTILMFFNSAIGKEKHYLVPCENHIKFYRTSKFFKYHEVKNTKDLDGEE